MHEFSRITLHSKKERSLKLFHPWVFSGAIQSIDGSPAEGDIVEVWSHDGDYLGTGHFHEGSIKVRIFSFVKTDASIDFWLDKFRNAYEFRKNAGIIDDPGTNIFRLIHAEGDGLPGLIIDVYDSVAVIQTHTVGMHNEKKKFIECLKLLFGNKLEAIYDKSSDTMGKQMESTISNGFLFGNKEEAVLKENGISIHINWVVGQKTGFFIDQKDNRRLLQDYCHGKKVLNTFSYSGGFSLFALKGNAAMVHSVDSSKRASELVDRNVALNNFTGDHASFNMDVFDFLKKPGEEYDVIILDPPAFAKHLSSVDNAMAGYRNLNTSGLKRLSKGGLLFTFSCSQVIDKVLFRKLVFQAAAQAQRQVRIIHQLTQGKDHPVNIYHPEGEYLKGLVLYVE